MAIKPGKPVTLGQLDDCVFLGLPGNPVSAFVTWTVFGRVLLDQLSGVTDPGLRYRYVTTQSPIHHKTGRCEFRPARITGCDGAGRDVIAVDDRVHAAQLRPLAGADGLVVLPAGTPTCAIGDLIRFLPFERPCL